MDRDDSIAVVYFLSKRQKPFRLRHSSTGEFSIELTQKADALEVREFLKSRADIKVLERPFFYMLT